MRMNEVKEETHACEYKLTNGEARQVETVQLRRRPPLQTLDEGSSQTGCVLHRRSHPLREVRVVLLLMKAVSSCY